MTPLMVALGWTMFYDDVVVRALLQHCPEKQVMMRDGSGFIALFYAIKTGRDLFVRMLLNHEPLSQVNMVHREAGNALLYAIRCDNVESAKTILDIMVDAMDGGQDSSDASMVGSMDTSSMDVTVFREESVA